VEVLAHRRRHVNAGGQLLASRGEIELPKQRGHSPAQRLQAWSVPLLLAAARWVLRRSPLEWAAVAALFAVTSALMGFWAFFMVVADRTGSDRASGEFVVTCLYATAAGAVGTVLLSGLHFFKWLMRTAQPRQ